jgi:hypothetical protein
MTSNWTNPNDQPLYDIMRLFMFYWFIMVILSSINGLTYINWINKELPGFKNLYSSLVPWGTSSLKETALNTFLVSTICMVVTGILTIFTFDVRLFYTKLMTAAFCIISCVWLEFVTVAYWLEYVPIVVLLYITLMILLHLRDKFLPKKEVI